MWMVCTNIRFTIVVVILVACLTACSRSVAVRENPVFQGFDESDTEVQPAPDVDVLALSEGMKAFVERDILQYKTKAQRLKALSDALFDQRKLALVYDAGETRTAIQVFESSLADCLSFANLFIAMARYADLDAHYQAVDIPLDWDLRKNIIVLNKHINVFGNINPSKSYTMDMQPYRVNVEVDTKIISDDSARAQYFNNKGIEFFRKGENWEALRYLKRAILIDPEIAFIWSNTGIVYTHIERYDAAEQFFKKAMKLEARNLSAMSNLASLYNKTGDEKKAFYYTKKVISYRLRNPYYRYAMGIIAYERGDYRLAVKHLKYAVRKKKNEYVFYVDLAKAYYRLGDYRAAEQSYQKAREMAPDDKKDIYQVPLARLLAKG